MRRARLEAPETAVGGGAQPHLTSTVSAHLVTGAHKMCGENTAVCSQEKFPSRVCCHRGLPGPRAGVTISAESSPETKAAAGKGWAPGCGRGSSVSPCVLS